MANQPAHQIRFGLIKAAVWRNRTKAGDRFTVSFVRLYRDGDLWRESTRFGRDDLLCLAKAADAAHTWIFEHSRDFSDA